MDPLFDIEEHFGESPDYDSALLERVRREEWFPQNEEVDEDAIYTGRNVRWVGTPGRMIRLGWDEIQATLGNPFDIDKVGTYAEMIREGDGYGGKLLVDAPPVMLTSVGLLDVVESREAAAEDELFDSYGMTRPFTTGDDELDEYLTDSEAFLESYAADADDEDVIMADMTERAEEAVSSCQGDLGKIVGYLRDGNHRTFAAQLAGEPYVWAQVRFRSPDELEVIGMREEDLE